jgi:hypothetical protein
LHVNQEERRVNLVAQIEEVYCFPEPIAGVHTIADVGVATITIALNDDYSTTAKSMRSFTPVISAGGWHAVGVRGDGTVVAAGLNIAGECEIDGWVP